MIILIVIYITAIRPYLKNLKTKCCTYVGLYGSGLFNFGCYVNLPTLFAYFSSFDIPTSSQFHFHLKCFATLVLTVVLGFVLYYAKVQL